MQTTDNQTIDHSYFIEAQGAIQKRFRIDQILVADINFEMLLIGVPNRGYEIDVSIFRSKSLFTQLNTKIRLKSLRQR